MTRSLAVPLLIAAVALTTGARELANPNEPVRPPTDYAPIMLHVACGELFEAACGKVLPRIAARAAAAGLELKPVETGAALDTAAAVCQGQTAAAIVPRDVVARLAKEPACLGRYDVVGRPLYPWYALLVVRADTAFRSLDDLARDGRQHAIAAGAHGSAGEITLDVLLRSNADWQRAIALTNDDAETALDRVANGSIDGFFAMETLDGGLIDRIRSRTDPRGKPLYAFIDVRPDANLLHNGDGVPCLYRLTALDFGGPSPVTTVSVDAVLMLGRAYHDAHARGGPRAADALASAIDAARIGILADMKSPGDWRPAGASCE